MGDRAASPQRARFEAIAAEVYEPLQRYLRRRVPAEDADELLDDVLLVVWQRLPAVPEDAVLPWCYGVARRVVANRRRSIGRRRRLLQRLGDQPAVAPDAALVAGEHPEISEALASLAEADQELLRLWAWEELAPREIAVVLGKTPNAVSLRLARAKKRLAGAMERQNSLGAGHKRSGDTGEAHG